jgi:hypothetical protein
MRRSRLDATTAFQIYYRPNALIKQPIEITVLIQSVRAR